MRHLLRILVIVTLAVPAVSAWAEGKDQTSYVPDKAQPAQQPQGPDAMVPLPMGSTGLVGYRPITEGMLPGAVAPATQIPGQQANVPVPTNLGGSTAQSSLGDYTLGKDDVVAITVQGQPDFTGTFVVGPEGFIQYGFIGDIKADGLTKDELAQQISGLLKEYVRVPVVSIAIVGFNSKAVYILGRVARPGKYAMRGDTVKIRDALIAAGLVTEHAKLSRIRIIKSDPDNPTHKVVNMKHVLYKGKMKDDVDLVNGDIVVVPTTLFGKISDFLASIFHPVSSAGSVAALATL